jgi:hypothetical protein
MNQRDAIVEAIVTVFAHANIHFEIKKTKASSLLTDELRERVVNRLTSQADDLEFDAPIDLAIDEALRNDPRLKGTDKNVNQSDPQLVALRKLMRSQTDSCKKEELQWLIDKRIAELNGAI